MTTLWHRQVLRYSSFILKLIFFSMSYIQSSEDSLFHILKPEPQSILNPEFAHSRTRACLDIVETKFGGLPYIHIKVIPDIINIIFLHPQMEYIKIRRGFKNYKRP